VFFFASPLCAFFAIPYVPYDAIVIKI